MRILHLGAGRSAMPQSGGFVDKLRSYGELDIIMDASNIPDHERAEMIRQYDVLLTLWGSMRVPDEIAVDPGRLRYICNITGELRAFVPFSVIQSGMLVTNWGDAPADTVAEGAMVLLLAVMKNLRDHIETVAGGGWRTSTLHTQASLNGCDVGIYGMGVIGRRFVELIKSFRPRLRVYDKYVKDLPDGCLAVGSLRELFKSSKIIVIHAGLSPETRRTVNAEMLSLLPDNGIIINTARGGIIDQDALFKELKSGRLRAGLDVLDGEAGDCLRENDEARLWSNLILTSHQVSDTAWGTDETLENAMRRVCLENMERFSKGEPMKFVMTEERYARST